MSGASKRSDQPAISAAVWELGIGGNMKREKSFEERVSDSVGGLITGSLPRSGM